MISNVNFTGREEMLNQTLKAAKKSYEYTGAGKIFTPAEIMAQDLIRKSNKATMPQFDAMAIDYAISHGTPKDAVVGNILNTLI